MALGNMVIKYTELILPTIDASVRNNPASHFARVQAIQETQNNGRPHSTGYNLTVIYQKVVQVAQVVFWFKI